MSVTFATSFGSVQNLNISLCQGCTLYPCHASATVLLLIPSRSDSNRALQWGTPRFFGGRHQGFRNDLAVIDRAWTSRTGLVDQPALCHVEEAGGGVAARAATTASAGAAATCGDYVRRLRAATTCGDDVSKKGESRVSVISRALPHHQPMKTDPEGTEKISCVRQQYQLRPQRISMYLARYQTSPSVRPVSGESFTSSASIGYPPHSATNVRRPGKCYENNAPAINCKWM